ncbi:hypothetical protein [Pseudooctadecabacter jejudonensis]|uniref:Uncharacterized protein n=1 Tax=Pseudooctadecabacter jejudonensis TaxID=1391910 RepID=A0A1Y5T1K3_9RHOB|nr:hypothetical protein [Pseudooctadecabacter jejudonensis]SLN51720.1 hypothetical protein PSJ8397_02715 [Pseudooctadecabacter jejudonensis]
MNRFMFAATAAVMAGLLPAMALADDRLDRLENVSEQANAVMIGLMAKEMQIDADGMAQMDEVLAKMQWDERMRGVGTCMLAAYEDEVGSGGVEDLLDGMEEAIAAMENAESMDDLDAISSFQPEGISEDRSIEISTDCGMLSVQMEMMDESGFMDLMLGAAMADG